MANRDQQAHGAGGNNDSGDQLSLGRKRDQNDLFDSDSDSSGSSSVGRALKRKRQRKSNRSHPATGPTRARPWSRSPSRALVPSRTQSFFENRPAWIDERPAAPNPPTESSKGATSRRKRPRVTRRSGRRRSSKRAPVRHSKAPTGSTRHLAGG